MRIARLILMIIIAAFFVGCMHQGMGMHGLMMGGTKTSTHIIREFNRNDKANRAIEKAMSDLTSQSLDISNVAVWRIRSQNAGLDVDLIRTKIISHLVSANTFQVISRERLHELLNEQQLSLSGIIDEETAVEIGGLIGIHGFIDGYAGFDGQQLILSLSLIETKTGKILWAKTVHSD